MSITAVNILETQHTVDAHDGFTPFGGQPAALGTPACVQANVTMSGAADYATGGYSLTLAQLGLTTAAQSALSNGLAGTPVAPMPGIAPYSSPGAAVSAAYNTSTNKLQFFAAGGAELAASSVVGGTWSIVVRGY